nr:uncharacterized protein LOC105862481 [Microcebus murinus]
MKETKRDHSRICTVRPVSAPLRALAALWPRHCCPTRRSTRSPPVGRDQAGWVFSLAGGSPALESAQLRGSFPPRATQWSWLHLQARQTSTSLWKPIYLQVTPCLCLGGAPKPAQARGTAQLCLLARISRICTRNTPGLSRPRPNPPPREVGSWGNDAINTPKQAAAQGARVFTASSGHPRTLQVSPGARNPRSGLSQSTSQNPVDPSSPDCPLSTSGSSPSRWRLNALLSPAGGPHWKAKPGQTSNSGRQAIKGPRETEQPTFPMLHVVLGSFAWETLGTLRAGEF